MATPAFKVGDIVKLKSGGPDMTVKRVAATSQGDVYECQWFAGKGLQSGMFPPESLDLKQP